MKKSLIINLLQTISLIAVIAGALGSLYLTLRAGHNNRSILLQALFTVWVLLPLILLGIENVLSRRWPDSARVALYCFILLLVPVSILGYLGVFSPPGTKNAFVFLVIPLISWMLIAIVLPILVSQSRKRDRI